MNKRTSVSLGGHFEAFIEEHIADGRYVDATDVIRAGLRLLEEEENRLVVLKKAIGEGIESGVAFDFDPVTNLERLKSAQRSNG